MIKPKINNKIDARTPLSKCLTECSIGESVKISRIIAGKNAKRRLANLGLLPGVYIKKIKSAPFRGPIGIMVKGSNLVVGRGLGSKVIVECNCFTQ